MYKAFDCLDQKAPLFGRFLLEASAGTGKTYAIEHLVVRLLLERQETKKNEEEALYLEEPLCLEEIVVITFTKAAASDVKERIRSNIEKVVLQIQKSKNGTKEQKQAEIFPYLLPFIEDEEKRQDAVKRLQKALNSFEAAQIFTIHSFCYRLIKAQGFLAGIFLPLTTEEKVMTTTIKERAIKWLFSEVDEQKVGRELMRLFLKRYSTVEEMAKEIVRNVEKLLSAEESKKNKEQEKIAT